MNDFLIISPCVETTPKAKSVNKTKSARGSAFPPFALTRAEERELDDEKGILCTAAFAAGFDLSDLARNLQLPNYLVALWLRDRPSAAQMRLLLRACREMRQRLNLPSLAASHS